MKNYFLLIFGFFLLAKLSFASGGSQVLYSGSLQDIRENASAYADLTVEFDGGNEINASANYSVSTTGQVGSIYCELGIRNDNLGQERYDSYSGSGTSKSGSLFAWVRGDEEDFDSIRSYCHVEIRGNAMPTYSSYFAGVSLFYNHGVVGF